MHSTSAALGLLSFRTNGYACDHCINFSAERLKRIVHYASSCSHCHCCCTSYCCSSFNFDFPYSPRQSTLIRLSSSRRLMMSRSDRYVGSFSGSDFDYCNYKVTRKLGGGSVGSQTRRTVMSEGNNRRGRIPYSGGGDVDAVISLLSEECFSSVENTSKEGRIARQRFEVEQGVKKDTKEIYNKEATGDHLSSSPCYSWSSSSAVQTVKESHEEKEKFERKLETRWDMRKKTEKRLEENLADGTIRITSVLKREDSDIDLKKKRMNQFGETVVDGKKKSNETTEVLAKKENDRLYVRLEESSEATKIQNVRASDLNASDQLYTRIEGSDLKGIRAKGKEKLSTGERKGEKQVNEFNESTNVSVNVTNASVVNNYSLNLGHLHDEAAAAAKQDVTSSSNSSSRIAGYFEENISIEDSHKRVGEKIFSYSGKEEISENSESTVQANEGFSVGLGIKAQSLADHHINIDQIETQTENLRVGSFKTECITETSSATMKRSKLQSETQRVELAGDVRVEKNEQGKSEIPSYDTEIQKTGFVTYDRSKAQRFEQVQFEKGEKKEEKLTAKRSEGEFRIIDESMQVTGSEASGRIQGETRRYNYASDEHFRKIEQEEEQLLAKQSQSEFRLLETMIQVTDSAKTSRSKTHSETRRFEKAIVKKGVDVKENLTEGQSSSEFDAAFHVTDSAASERRRTQSETLSFEHSSDELMKEEQQQKEKIAEKQTQSEIHSFDTKIHVAGCSSSTSESQFVSETQRFDQYEKEKFAAKQSQGEIRLHDINIQVTGSASTSETQGFEQHEKEKIAAKQSQNEIHLLDSNIHVTGSASACETQRLEQHKKEKFAAKQSQSDFHLLDSNIQVTGSASTCETQRLEQHKKEKFAAKQSQSDFHLLDSNIQVTNFAITTETQRLAQHEKENFAAKQTQSEVHLLDSNIQVTSSASTPETQIFEQHEKERFAAKQSQSEIHSHDSDIQVAGSASTSESISESEKQRFGHSSKAQFKKRPEIKEKFEEKQSHYESQLLDINIQLKGSATASESKSESETQKLEPSSDLQFKRGQQGREKLEATQNRIEFQLPDTDIQLTGSSTLSETHTSDAHLKLSETHTSDEQEGEGLSETEGKSDLQSLDTDIQVTNVMYETNELTNISVNLVNQSLGYPKSNKDAPAVSLGILTDTSSSHSSSRLSDKTANPPGNIDHESNEPEIKKHDTESSEAEASNDSALTTRSGKTLWGIISSIFRVSRRSESRNTIETSGEKVSSNESMSSEAYYSGREHDEKSDDIVPKITSPGSSIQLESGSSSGKNDDEDKQKARMLQRTKQVSRDRFDAWEEAYVIESEQRNLDEMFMREALEEAKKAGDLWEVPVGAVLVHNGAIISRGHNLVERLRDSTAHAEMMCIREASNQLRSWRLADATLYVTLEPCPMCAGAILQARVKTLVWGAPNKLLGADGSWIRLFPGNGGEGSDMPGPVHPFHPNMTIRRGVLGTECADVMQQFFQLRRRKKNKDEEEENPPRSTLQMANRHTKFVSRMHDIFHSMLCM